MLKASRSNSNGTYYGLAVEHVNRNSAGYVDFEKVRHFSDRALKGLLLMESDDRY